MNEKPEKIIDDSFWNLCQQYMEEIENWNFEWKNEKVEVHSKSIFKNSEMNAIKCFACLDYPVDLVYKVFLDVETRSKWSPQVISCKLLEKGFFLIF
jgi:hypothetical protein